MSLLLKAAGILAVTIFVYWIWKWARQELQAFQEPEPPHQVTPVRRSSAPQNSGVSRYTPISQRSETGSMIYFANDRWNSPDKEYRFNFKNINGAWRAYILKMPSLNGRDPRATITHRMYDGPNAYVCWNTAIYSLKDMQTVARKWADSMQEYIATGRHFG